MDDLGTENGVNRFTMGTESNPDKRRKYTYNREIILENSQTIRYSSLMKSLR